MSKIKLATLFSGAGGLDLGFQLAGFDLAWSNEFDKNIWETHEINFPKCLLDKRSITKVEPNDIPDVDGFIGGPPCQSWSEAGARRGINDERGQLFHEYIRLLKAKQPKFFLAENVSGILHAKHSIALSNILNEFSLAGYNVTYRLLNASDYNVPQDRKRLIIVGLHHSINKEFIFPEAVKNKLTLKDAIFDLKDNAVAAIDKNKKNPKIQYPNHEYMTGDFSSIFLSRNRVRGWDEQSFTIQAGGRHAPIHPNAPKMIKIAKDKFEFVPEKKDLYRRMSIRECARVQTFPDDFIFSYTTLDNGYKMVGNAVPVEFAKIIATSIKEQIF